MTISGTDLGTSFEKIVNITIGSLNCAIIVSSYVVGEQVSCIIANDSSQQIENDVDIALMVNTTLGPIRANSTSQFRYFEPKIVSVSPTFGPAAGGTIMRVSGTYLNIGNQESTRVLLITNGIELASCNIS